VAIHSSGISSSITSRCFIDADQIVHMHVSAAVDYEPENSSVLAEVVHEDS
jgi:hypothetical protein